MKAQRIVSFILGVSLAVYGAPIHYLHAQPKPAGQQNAGGEVDEKEYGKDANTEINVKNADIAALVRIFSRKTKRNYILDEKVRGKVSIYLPGKVSPDEALRILDSVLALKGFTSVPIGENLWKIVPSKEARQSTIPTITDGGAEKPTAAVVTRLINLKYVNSQDIQQILSQLVSPDGLVNAYTGTNSLIVIDSEDNIQRLVRLVDELDVPFSNREMTIIPVKHADVEDIAQKLNEILGEGQKKEGGTDPVRASMGDPSGGVMPPAGAPAQAISARATSRTVSARGLEPKILPDQRTNSIIVVADDETTARIRALIAQLDSKIDLSGNKFYVYRCQHANAEELTQVLAGLVGGGPVSSGGNSFQQGMLGDDQPGLGGTPSGKRDGSGSTSVNGRKSSRGSGKTAGVTSTKLGENISITADPATNSLIIAASKPDYEKIRTLLSQIDVKRRQALVEATLLEVSIDNSVRESMSFLTSTGGDDGGGFIKSDFAPSAGSLNSLFLDPKALSGFTLAAASAGSLSLPGGITIPTQSLLISAAQNSNNVNVLSAPTILATDNEEAEIIVGQNVPFLASTSTNATNLNNTFNTVDRQDVGITLRITPQISSRDYVTLKVFTEVSAVIPSTLNSSLGPTTTKRQSDTTIIAKDGQMIVTGGLIADDVSESDDGLPYFKDIPVLGHAFKANSQVRLQKNLLIFLLPRIVKDQFDARDATIEGRDYMKDVVKNYDVAPRRTALLDNEAIDEVAETAPYEGQKPGTALAPEKMVKSARSSSDRIEQKPSQQGDTLILDGSKDGTLNLEFSPTVTKSGKEDAVLDLNSLGTAQDPHASLNSTTIRPAQPAMPQGTYVLLELADKKDYVKDLPFLEGARSRTAGVYLPQDSSGAAKTFFKAGQTYSYNWNGEKVAVRVKEVRSTAPTHSAGSAPLPKTWHTLAPYEIMNLGKGPWSRGSSK